MTTSETKHFRISNSTSGQDLGIYEGADADAAIRAMMDDAGCTDEPDEDLVATEVEHEPTSISYAAEAMRDEEAACRWTVTTDAATTTVEADDEDEAARRFAASEDLDGIESAADLREWAESLGGWCRIVRQ